MTKYRSREIIEAEEWQPGKQIDGVHELRDGRGVLEVPNSEVGFVLFAPPKFQEIKPGDVIATRRDDQGKRLWCMVISRETLARHYEDIGG